MHWTTLKSSRPGSFIKSKTLLLFNMIYHLSWSNLKFKTCYMLLAGTLEKRKKSWSFSARTLSVLLTEMFFNSNTQHNATCNPKHGKKILWKKDWYWKFCSILKYYGPYFYRLFLVWGRETILILMHNELFITVLHWNLTLCKCHYLTVKWWSNILVCVIFSKMFWSRSVTAVLSQCTVKVCNGIIPHVGFFHTLTNGFRNRLMPLNTYKTMNVLHSTQVAVRFVSKSNRINKRP